MRREFISEQNNQEILNLSDFNDLPIVYILLFNIEINLYFSAIDNLVIDNFPDDKFIFCQYQHIKLVIEQKHFLDDFARLCGVDISWELLLLLSRLTNSITSNILLITNINCLSINRLNIWFDTL